MAVSLVAAHTRTLEQYRRRYPGWWVLVLAVGCWLAIAATHLGFVTGGTGTGHDPAISSAGHHLHAGSGPGEWNLAGMARMLADWLLMAVAMMAPLAMPAVRHVAYNSFDSRRFRGSAIFLVSSLAIWIPFGIAVLGLRWSWDAYAPGLAAAWPLSFALLAAALWQFTPWKRRALNACRSPVPLRPFGYRADLSCMRFGVVHGWRCLLSCWAIMLAMGLMSHGGLPLMLGLSAVAVAEQRVHWRSRTRILQASGLALGVIAALAVLGVPVA